ncbi:hypothetical protein HYFRA_00007990 [Hymenoscyphus fraxineus]|uniref:Riboflavin kinase n=1 Tax=Hymenoscyphus fraxineus TaxID=746836 RepID=A0A9N9KSJ3_9HELO|nr:hypothetical protein HYFRA_00007990 [Hymenoscyphus fraxineus]
MSESAPARQPRDEIVGAVTGPEKPYPLRMEGEVIAGFGRGSKDLGIPTANLPVASESSDPTNWIHTSQSGVYFGWASIRFPSTHTDLSLPPSLPSFAQSPPLSDLNIPSYDPKSDSTWRIYPMVMSIGFNPFYKNTVRSAEVYIMNQFEKDFYGAWMRISILGFIRPELDYVDRESLIKDIHTDVDVALKSLGREAWWVGGEERTWLGGEGWVEKKEGIEEKGN